MPLPHPLPYIVNLVTMIPPGVHSWVELFMTFFPFWFASLSVIKHRWKATSLFHLIVHIQGTLRQELRAETMEKYCLLTCLQAQDELPFLSSAGLPGSLQIVHMVGWIPSTPLNSWEMTRGQSVWGLFQVTQVCVALAAEADDDTLSSPIPALNTGSQPSGRELPVQYQLDFFRFCGQVCGVFSSEGLTINVLGH